MQKNLEFADKSEKLEYAKNSSYFKKIQTSLNYEALFRLVVTSRSNPIDILSAKMLKFATKHHKNVQVQVDFQPLYMCQKC
jgi:malate/lactate dehydrogenase